MFYKSNLQGIMTLVKKTTGYLTRININYSPFIRAIFTIMFFFTLLAPNITAQDPDRPPASSEVDYSPADGEVSATNPPPFIWLPAEGQDSYLLQYSRSASFRPSQTVTVRDIDMTVHIPTNILEPGTWYWRFGYNDGGTDRFSMTRKFEIPKSAVHFPLVTADEFIERIPRERPRLYFSPGLVQELRTDAEGRYERFTRPVIEQAEKILAMNEPLFREPDPWPQDYRDIYNNAWRTMRPYTQRMVTSALAYLYSGDVRYAEEAKRRLMHFMSWDVKGSSSTIWPTELGMDIAANATPVFDWIYDFLSDEERRICTEVMTARMVQINRDVHRAMPMESRPFSSHPGRMVGFALEGGIVLAHEVPEAREWIDYTLKLVWSTYPAWGGDEGGWHEGIHYWSAYMQMILRVVHELDHYGIPLKNKPFFRNTGYFGLYAAYPDRPTAAFGDGHHIPLRAATGTVTYLLSNLYNNPWFRWHSEQIGSGPSGREAVRAYNPGLQSRSPDELPQSRVFYDVGLVAMHSRMSDPDNNVMMLFKSNPFGAISHNHASQNAFVIEAFKEPLAISSGYRQTHGIPHHREWIWQTKAHNSILVDNEGQVPRQRSSKGEIIAYQEHDSYVYTTGDATAAYGGRLEKFHRHVLFVRPGYFVIIDDLKTSGSSSTYQWLFHAKNQMEVDDQNNVVVSTSGDARLALRFLTPGNLEFSQHTGFDPPVEDPSTAPDQFHLTASTIDPSPEQRFVTVLWVDRDGAVQSGQDRQGSGSPPAPAAGEGDGGSLIRTIGNSGVGDKIVLQRAMQDAELLEAEGGIALRVGDDLVFWKEPGERRVSAAGTSSRKDMEVKAGFFR
jgi:hypothetical protein